MKLQLYWGTLSANNDQEQAGVLSAIKTLCFNATLENLASNALKGFGSFQHEPSGVRVFLLDNRKLYTFDQARVRNIANNIAKENARAAQLSEQDERKMPSQKPKSSKKKSKKVVKSKSGSECEEEPELLRYSSSSSVSIPCEGAHTDSEEELQQEGISTPVITGEAATKSSGIPAFNIGDAFSVQGAKSDSRAQDKSKQKRHRKKERKQRVSKPKPSKHFKKSSKKDKKSRTKKHKSIFLATDQVLPLQAIQSTVLHQTTPHLGIIPVLIRYFKFNFEMFMYMCLYYIHIYI